MKGEDSGTQLTVDSIRNAAEIVLSQCLLVGVECAVVCSRAVEVTPGGREREALWMLIRGEGRVSLCQEVHEVSGGGGVGSEGGSHHMTRGVAPAGVPVVGPISAETRSDRLTKHHVT